MIRFATALLVLALAGCAHADVGRWQHARQMVVVTTGGWDDIHGELRAFERDSGGDWRETGAAFRAANPRTSGTKDNRMKEALIRLPHARVTWLCALFLLGYVGIEVALGGWIVKFMLEVRDGEEFASGMVATGFWMGITVGRIVLGFVTPRLGEKLAITVSVTFSFFSMSCFLEGFVSFMFDMDILTLVSNADLPSPHNGSRTHLLARPPILRLGRCSKLPRVLPRSIIPCCRCRRYEASTTPSTCGCDWFCGSFWWEWSCHLPLCGWSYRAGAWCTGSAADYSGAIGRNFGVVARVAKDT